MSTALVLYTVISMGMELYMIYLNEKNVYEWELPDKEKEIGYYDSFQTRAEATRGALLVQYVIAWVLFMIGKKTRFQRAMDLIVFGFCICNSLQFFINKPFKLDNPRQYVLRSTIISIRSAAIIAIFGVNGFFDVVCGLCLPLLAVLCVLPQTQFPPGSINLCMPAVLVAVVGCAIFVYMVLEEQRRLFANE